ncbi:MAG TPA: hypothetical protein VI547_06410 [Anaerolineales bacterium]|nr:hypothetical protein [Anaerolineales bacterium]
MQNRTMWIGLGALVGALAVGQVLTYVIAPGAWTTFVGTLQVVIAQIAFWGPICALFSAGIVALTLRLLGFESLDEIRKESVEQNNPTPAIVFVGTLIASILFLTLVIRP